MDKENSLVNKFLKQISKMIDYKLEKLTTVESAIVDQVNLDGTVNLHIPPDTAVFTNIQNQSIYQNLKIGDNVKVLKQNGKASNMWIIGAHGISAEKTSSFKGIDFIVEQGTSGIWTYRKWNSGMAECWGTASVSVLCKNQNGSGYFTDDLTIALPTGLFTENGVVNLNCHDYWCWIAKAHMSQAENVKFRIARSSDYQTVFTTSVDISARGRWK